MTIPEQLFIIFFYFSLIVLIFGLLIAIGCWISPTFKKEFINDWKRW